MSRPRSAILAVWLLIGIAVAAVTYSVLPDYQNAAAEQRRQAGTVVLDRGGRVLRIFPDGEARFTLWRGIDEFPQPLKLAVLAAEDKRFYHHPGFDPIATLRAICVNLRSWKTVSGASTITQQVVRLIQPRPRTYRSKIIELLCSLKMEWQLSKDQILELYLNLSPMGGNIRGAGLAAKIYFDKDVRHVNLAEAGVLAAIPRSPSRYDPRWPGGRVQVLNEKDSILHRAADEGWIDRASLKILLGKSVQFRITKLPVAAPHFVDFLMAREPLHGPVLKTTLDSRLQRSLEEIVRSHGPRLARIGIEQAGVIVAALDGDILGMVGSIRYGPQGQGFNNAVLAERGAGSTLKPFLYAMALDEGAESTTEIADTFRGYWTPQGDYLPLNADRRSYGPVNVQIALGNSLNISAVKVMQQLGLNDFYQLLERLEVLPHGAMPADHYGLGLAIGNVEASLYRLVQAYGALARRGVYARLRSVEGERAPEDRVFTEETAYVITHILSDPSARLLTFGNPSYLDFGFPVALKTGTSSNFRDCWLIGYTPSHVIGVWAGNFSGRPSNGVAGSVACGPIFQDIIRRLYHSRPPPNFTKPVGLHQDLVCSMSGKLATEQCPYTTRAFLRRTHADRMPRCDLPHDSAAHHYLGPAYAQWIDRRETLQGASRFRLMNAQTEVFEQNPRLQASLSSSLPVRQPAPVEIVSPHESDRFVLSPHYTNRILFRAVPCTVVDHLVWLVDGVEIGRTPPPYELFWDAVRGTHEVHAVTPNGQAARVTIHVE